MTQPELEIASLFSIDRARFRCFPVKRANLPEITVNATATGERMETEGRAGSARRLSVDGARFRCFPVKHGNLREITDPLGDGGADGVFP